MKSREIRPYTRKAYYYETDKMGIVHHSNYIRWLEEARVHMLNEVGYPFEKIEAMGLYMPVLSVECQYKYPVKFDDIFEIQP
ncbi:MAG: acyl-CoA thioesterase, partial [Oscillospiraceae bacterium]